MIDIANIITAHHYDFNPYSVPPIIVASLVFLLGFFAFSLERETQFNRSLLYMCASSTIWLFGYSFVLNAQIEQVAFFWTRIMYSGLVVFPATLLHISLAYTNRYESEQRFIKGAYIVSVLFIGLVWAGGFLSGVRNYPWGFHPEAGTWQPLFLIFILFCPILGLLNLIKYYFSLTEKLDKKRTEYLIIAFIFVSLSAFDILASYGIKTYPFGYIATLIFVVVMTFSIIKYRNLMVESYARELERKVAEKTQEMSKIVEELRKTQVKLIETGKISALASLSAGILHQVSQPVTAIHGFARFVKKEMKEDNAFYKPIKIIEEQAVYLKDMLEDLMELIRHREIKKENINVNASIKRATDLLTDELRIKRVNWSLNFAENLPLVYADAVHIQQISMNILVNAMQALSVAAKGEDRIIKITTRFDAVMNKVVITFQDNGPGIPEEDQHQIFEPFFSTKTKGSGIGLALCKDLVAEHGGEIKFESHPGQGTAFIIMLPPVSK
ncbi:MAG: ATP-binding protein [Candidatus Omnitrophota bacterium]